MKKIIKPVFSDDRGDIIDILAGIEIDAVTLITFTKGAVRANHYHKETTQWNYVLKGEVRYVSKKPNEDAVEEFLTKGDFVCSEPFQSHAFEGNEDSNLLILTKGPRAGKDYESDTYRLEVPLIKYKEKGL
ncbi:cupin domain-containing protein [SAR86 cluster bacterium]|jgi:quercetin dioxygenase-like cupin family protein|nr:cupin domain-containing protein [SAR86 cluster bacterium]